MANNLQNQPPSTPVAAATRPPPDSTDAQKKEALRTIRLARHVSKLRDPKDFKDDEKEQTVAVFVNNGQHGGYRAIGRYFPNGLTADVQVTDEELTDLRAEPQDIIKVVDASEVASLAGKGSSANLSPEEQRVLAAFRSSGLGSDAFLAQAQKTGTGTSSASSGSGAPSKASGDADTGSQEASKQAEFQSGKRK